MDENKSILKDNLIKVAEKNICFLKSINFKLLKDKEIKKLRGDSEVVLAAAEKICNDIDHLIKEIKKNIEILLINNLSLKEFLHIVTKLTQCDIAVLDFADKLMVCENFLTTKK